MKHPLRVVGGRYSFSPRGSCSCSFLRGSNRNNSIFCSRFSHTSHHLGNLGKKIYVNMKNINECRSKANTNLGLGKYCANGKIWGFKGNYSIFGCSSVSKGKCNCSRSLMGSKYFRTRRQAGKGSHPMCCSSCPRNQKESINQS